MPLASLLFLSLAFAAPDRGPYYLEGPADLGYDTRRQRLLIPLVAGHSLAIFELSPLRPASDAPRADPDR